MSINKNDCLDCNNSNREGNSLLWTCSKGHIIKHDEHGIPAILETDCGDFEYIE